MYLMRSTGEKLREAELLLSRWTVQLGGVARSTPNLIRCIDHRLGTAVDVSLSAADIMRSLLL
jgi:hypothetical protein